MKPGAVRKLADSLNGSVEKAIREYVVENTSKDGNTSLKEDKALAEALH